MIPIQIADYKDYLVITGNKTCPQCKEEHPETTDFKSQFPMGEKMCSGCLEEAMQMIGEL